MSLNTFNKQKFKFTGGAAMWRKLSFAGATLIGICMINVLLSEKENKKQEFVKYEHLRRRSKQFPWGDGNKTLLHNPKVNALPDGYECEIPPVLFVD